jgi:ABC-type glycerol-3-phosphate transport system substrate-binding protein
MIFGWIVMGIILLTGMSTSMAEGYSDTNLVEERYSITLSQWEQQGLQEVNGVSIRVTPSNFIVADQSKILTSDKANGYNHEVLHMKPGDWFEVDVEAPKDGLYTLSFDYYLLTKGLISSEYSVQVNGVYPYFEARRIILPALWENKAQDFPKDRYGNEVMPAQNRISKWQTVEMVDPSYLNPSPMKVFLKEGKNRIKVSLTSGEVLSGDLILSSPQTLIPYEAYLDHYKSVKPGKKTLLIQEAEKTAYKNDTSINAITSRDLEAVPYDTNLLLLNTLGGETWKRSGQSVYYEFNIPKDGLYQIGVKYLQSVKPNAQVFRTLTIDGKIPFQEVKNYPFPYTNEWETEVLQGKKEPYLFYFTKGTHRIGLTADASPYYEVIQLLQSSIQKVNQLSLQIRKLVGNDVDKYRDWEITEYMPTIQNDLEEIAKALKKEHKKAVKLNHNNRNAQGLISLQIAIKNLENLAKEPNEIPKRLRQLNEGSGSITQNLSMAIQEFEKQPLTIDQIYVFSKDKKLPSYQSSWLKKVSEGLKRFFHSFAPSHKEKEAKITLNVWINRPRNYMDMLQRMTDEEFTPKTGIKVNFSTLPNEQRLTLANASGTAPDLALGISNWIPYELGVRGAALDLKKFEDFDKVIKPFTPGAFLPFIVNDQVYGMPETQDFYVLFYRKDLLQSLNIPIPDTWEDVIEILPELQRYGMNFYTPIAGAPGSKPFMVTAPFIYQMGGDMFGENAFKTGIDSKESLQGIQLMTDLFTIYGLPMQVPNFFEHFRNGTMPIGISNFTTYTQLQVAAPELMGSWEIAPAPGIRRNGETVRWQPGSAQVAMIFKNTKHPDEAWEFLKWWVSADTQVNFANQLQTLYGKEYMWNTANTIAFQQLFWPEEDKKVILEQWKWLKEVPKTPGGYMIERELSNIWTRVVFEGENIRSTVEDSVIEINKEISRKMEEFGYLRKGKVVVPYHVPTIEDVESWVKGRDGN